MLQAYPTKNGTGVSLFGDYGDLNSLYQAVHDIAGSINEDNQYQKGNHQLLMNFAYEIRKAYSGQRLTEEMQFPGEAHKLHYYGFQVVWTDILIFISAMRHHAGYIQTGKLYQGCMYLLEYVIERALTEYDAAGAAGITPFLTHGVAVSNEYAFIIYQAIHIDYVSAKSGKARFRTIPRLLRNYFNSWSPEYKELIASFQRSANEQNCKVIDLEFHDFPEIKW
jgi:hypothetical protein